MLSLLLFAVQPVPMDRLIQMSIVRYGYYYSVPTSTLAYVIRCESFNGIYQLNSNEVHGESKGVAQFRQSTFDHYSKEAGIENANVWDIEDSIQTLAFMVNIGEGDHFSCYRKWKKNNSG